MKAKKKKTSPRTRDAQRVSKQAHELKYVAKRISKPGLKRGAALKAVKAAKKVLGRKTGRKLVTDTASSLLG